MRQFTMGLFTVAVAFTGSIRAADLASEARPHVTVTGGADETGHYFSWTIENRGSSPIVGVQFRHNMADLFFVPDGWSTEGTTNLINVGVTATEGVCVATASAPGAAIGRGQSEVFSLRIAPAGATPGPGEFRIRFADGSEVVVADVELPHPRFNSDTHVPLIGLGGILAVWLLVRWARGRRNRTAPKAHAAPSENHAY